MTQTTVDSNYSHSMKALLPLFERGDADWLQYLCCFLRVLDKKDEGWDPLNESRQMLEDLIALNNANLSSLDLDNADKTHLRLHLISYVHLTEMSAPYFMMANLLRIHAQLPYTVNPFRMTDATIKSRRPIAKSQHKQTFRKPLPSAHHKISEIGLLAAKADLNSVSQSFEDFYVAPLRNAIAHSDYTLEVEEMHLIGNQIKDRNNPHLFTSRLSLIELGEIIAKAYDFYTAFFLLESVARKELGKLAGGLVEYQQQYKGILEFLSDEQGAFSGFVIHWPNQKDSFFQRTRDRIKTQNMTITSEGEIAFIMGKEFPNWDFSPLVPKGKTAKYTPSYMSKKALKWSKI